MKTVSVEFTVIDATDFVDRTDPNKPKDMVLVTYQDAATGRVGSISIPKGTTPDQRNRLIADAIKKAPARPFERVRV